MDGQDGSKSTESDLICHRPGLESTLAEGYKLLRFRLRLHCSPEHSGCSTPLEHTLTILIDILARSGNLSQLKSPANANIISLTTHQHHQPSEDGRFGIGIGWAWAGIGLGLGLEPYSGWRFRFLMTLPRGALSFRR